MVDPPSPNAPDGAAPPAGEGEELFVPGPLPVDLDDGEIAIDPLDDGAIDPLRRGERDMILPSAAQTAQATELYNLANASTGLPPLTPDAVERALMADSGQNAVSALVSGIQQEDESVHREAVLDLLGDPTDAVEARLEQVRRLTDEKSRWDVNIIQRQALHNLNDASFLQDDSEEAEFAHEAGAEYIESLSKDHDPVADTAVSREEYQQAFQILLNGYAQEADAASSYKAEWDGDLAAASLIPFRFQAPVIEIYNKLGVGDSFPAAASGTVLMGEGLAQIRAHIKTLDERGKIEALQMMMAVLKPNPGLLGDGNDWVTLHVLSQVFHTELNPELGRGLGATASTTAMGALASGAPTAAGNIQGLMAGAQSIEAGAGVALNRMLDNAGSLLDSVGVGALARGTIKLGAKFLPAAVRRAQKVDPETVNRAIVDALGDPELRARVGNMTPEEIAATFLPSASKVLQEGGVNGLHDLLARNLEIREVALRVGGTTNLSKAERSSAWKEMKDQLGEVAAQPDSTLHLDKSVIADRGNDMEISALFGRTKDRGWSQLGNARKAAQEQIKTVFGVDAEVSIVARNPKTGAFVEVGAGVPDKQIGEFYLQAKDVRAYDSMPTTFHELAFDKGAIANTMFSPGRWLNKLSLGFSNPSNIFSKQLVAEMSHVKGLQTRWQTLALDMVKQVAQLKQGQQKMLSRILKEGESARTSTGRGRTFNVKQLKARGADDATVKAYMQTRMMADIMYDVSNRATRTKMLRQGLMDIQGSTGRIGFGKPLRAQDAIGDIKVATGRQDLDVFDPATGTFSRMGASEIDAHYQRGGTLARMTTPVMTKNGEALHVLVDPKAGSRLYGLPRQVLTKVEGYYPHVWEGNYVVFGKTKNGNRVAMGLAKSQKDAAAAVARRNAALANRVAKGKKTSNWQEFGFEFDRSLSDVGYRGMMAEDMYVNMGGLVYGRRNGGKLHNFSKADGDILVDPLESLLRGMEVIGQSVTKDELMHVWQQRLLNYLKVEGLQLENPRALPDIKTNRIIPRTDKAEATSRAQAALEQIEFYKRVPDAVDGALSKWLLGAANTLARMGDMKGVGPLASWLEKGASSAAARPPGWARLDSAMMAFMHRYSIASSPLRHGALGITQSLMVFGLDPVAYTKAVSQTAGVLDLVFYESIRLQSLTGKRGAADFDKAYKIAGKLVPGMDEKELRAFVRMLFDSGLTSSVAHHSQMRNSLRSLAFERMRTTTNPAAGMADRLKGVGRTVDDLTYGMASRVGFEFGENINRVITTLMQYNADKAKKLANLSDPDYVRGLVGRVNELVGNMTPELGFGFQRGFFKNVTQFWSFQLKMLHLMLPEMAGGSRALTGAEKMRLTLGQFLLFGRRGGAHMDAIYRYVDMKMAEQEADKPDSGLVEAWRSPEVQAAMQGLVFDYTLNQMAKAINGPDTPDFALSEAFAPGGGTEFVLDAVTDLGSMNIEDMTGLSGERASKLVKYMRRVSGITLAQLEDYDDVPVDERFDQLLKEGAGELFSQYNRALAVRAAEKMDGFVSAGGVISEGYSGALEGYLYEHFGIMSREREDLYEDMEKFMAKHNEDPDSNLQEMADTYFKDFVETATRLDAETADRDEVFNDMLDKWTRERGLLFSMLEPQEAERVHELVRDRITRMLKNPDSSQKRFVERIVKDVTNAEFGNEGPTILKYLQNQSYVKDNPELVETIDRAFHESITPEE